MKHFYLVTISLLFPLLSAAQDTSKTSPFALSASYISDHATNLSGGIRRGYGYLGMINLDLMIDVEKAGLWKGGSFYIHAANTYGSVPSERLYGDIQVASNIEAGNHTYLQELYFKQVFKRLELTVGLQDLNVEFANSEYGALFLNSSFGIMPVISGNLAAPIFPLTSLGITANFRIHEKLKWLVAFYDGCPTDFKNNPVNLKWQFNSGDGLLAITEFQRTGQIRQLPGIYKIGLFSHNHMIQNTFGESLPDSVSQSVMGVYAHVDQVVWEGNGRNLAVFTQAGYSPSERSSVRSYLGMGLNMSGFLSKRKNDILGLAVAHAQLSEGLGSETSIELTWAKPIHKHISVQPDLQYIIQPSGKESNIRNSLAGIFRVVLSF